MPPEVTDNPLLDQWRGPYGGVPPLDRVRIEQFEPALEAAMAEQLEEVERIATAPEAPTFENTIEALERSGQRLERVRAVYGVWSGTMSGPEFQAVERTMAPRLAAFRDRIVQNEALFARIDAVQGGPDRDRLDAEQQRLCWHHHRQFVRAGARLDATAKGRLAAINQQLAGLYTRFNQNVLADETEQYLEIRSEAELAGLPRSARESAAESAAALGLDAGWAIANTRSAMEPFLTHADRRDLRERAWRLFFGRGESTERDNYVVVAEILSLRAERARLLGYPTHAHWRLEDTMAGSPERALALMEEVWTPALARVRDEVAAMQAIASEQGVELTIEPWDYRYYAEKVRRARYAVDQDEVQQYLQLDRLVAGMFWVAEELFGFRFERLDDVPVYHPDVAVWRVTRRDGGGHVGLFYFDPYSRRGKRSGAWMSAYRRQARIDGEVATIVSNNSNFIQGRRGEPVLVSWTDATTLFHEFGHALHGLASDVRYPSLSGTAVFRDWVEFPSQLLEHWLGTPEVLQRYALHHRTGEPLPSELADRVQRVATFDQGFSTVEYLASGIVDMHFHLADSGPVDPRELERRALSELGMPREVAMRHRTPHFSHLFGGDGYSAGYYSYLWSDVITADAVEAFEEAGGLYDREVARRLLHEVLAVGNTIDPGEAYRRFRGRNPRIDALMRKRGFAAPGLPAAG